MSTLPSTENAALGGLPRRRPLESKRGIQAISELRQLRPPIDLMPGTEATFLLQGELTKSKCSQWLHIAKQFYIPPVIGSEGLPLRNLPPISFLNLVIDWIDEYAIRKRRKKIKSANWRWRALQGFVHDHPKRDTRAFLKNVSRLARSIAKHFSNNVPFDDRLLAAWGDWLCFKHPSRPRGSDDSNTMERGRQADRVFSVLSRFAKNRKVCANDTASLEPFLSPHFHKPFFIEALHDKKESQSLSEFIAYAAAMDVYLRHLKNIKNSRPFETYVGKATEWAIRLGEPGVRPEFEVIHWRFCSRSTESPPTAKKNLRGSARLIGA